MNSEDLIALLDAWHPAVAAGLRALWGEPEFNGYISGLLLQTGHQQGFDEAIWRAIAKLQELHMATFPQYVAGKDLYAFSGHERQHGMETA